MSLGRLFLEADLAGLRPLEWERLGTGDVKCSVGKGNWQCAARGTNGREALENLLRRMRVI